MAMVKILVRKRIATGKIAEKLEKIAAWKILLKKK